MGLLIGLAFTLIFFWLYDMEEELTVNVALVCLSGDQNRRTKEYHNRVLVTEAWRELLSNKNFKQSHFFFICY